MSSTTSQTEGTEEGIATDRDDEGLEATPCILKKLSAVNLQLNKFSTAFFCADPTSHFVPVDFLSEDGEIEIED